MSLASPLTDRDGVPSGVAASVVDWWTSLESDWQAVCLGALLVVLVRLGLPIPW
ncbi:hypothetical protein VB773_19320 [Haloarculaceae archaeon H-GB2-1]|nr:hypothetical protein [Haloarculaceae archaeon H-GB1-1]MEA5388024.1 hypothetical protein [Haloarculaceae archaeon H-GB11]MEA5409512.1 hypothetical protein [Haloarculaceae archaeon H-GB2-1]